MAAIVKKGDPDAAAVLSACLVDGGIAIAPCDTIYGIHGCAPGTEGRIRRIKGRGESKPFLILHPSVDSVVELAVHPIPLPILELLPGPLTLILQTNGGKKGLRVPADRFILTVLEKTGPLFSTSVNRSGEPPMHGISNIKESFSEDVELIIDGGDVPANVPSTILDISEKPFTLVREGAMKLPEVVLRLCR